MPIQHPPIYILCNIKAKIVKVYFFFIYSCCLLLLFEYGFIPRYYEYLSLWLYFDEHFIGFFFVDIEWNLVIF